jgi:D-alanine-D-alanine ligase
MNKLNIAIIFGGVSSEHEVSISSASTIINNISYEKYNVIPIYITKSGKWLMYDGNINDISKINWDKHGTRAVLSPDTSKCIIRITTDKLNYIPIDVIFPVLHGSNGEDGKIQGLFELCKIPYVGCDVCSSAMCMDKSVTSKIVSRVGVNCIETIVYKKSDIENIELLFNDVTNKLGLPCFVKPSSSGSSVGVSKVNNLDEFSKAIDNALIHDTKVMVQKAVFGRELECSVLGDGDRDTICSGIGEILPANDFYDYESKYINNESKTIIHPILTNHIVDEIKDYSLKIFKELGCSGLSRVDFFLEDKTNKVIFNEINTLPGFTSISMYPMLWDASGIPINTLIDRLIEIALLRNN